MLCDCCDGRRVPRVLVQCEGAATGVGFQFTSLSMHMVQSSCAPPGIGFQFPPLPMHCTISIRPSKKLCSTGTRTIIVMKLTGPLPQHFAQLELSPPRLPSLPALHTPPASEHVLSVVVQDREKSYLAVVQPAINALQIFRVAFPDIDIFAADCALSCLLGYTSSAPRRSLSLPTNGRDTAA
eukprot:scpid80893/ scgid14282/ 